MNNNFFWEKFNKRNFKLGFSSLFDKKKYLDEITYPYNQINEIKSTLIVLLESLKKKISILDYGGSLISNSYLFRTTQKKFRNKNFFKNIMCSIYNPHYSFLDESDFYKYKKKILKISSINFINKIPKNLKYDLVIFGSCLQYENNLKNIDIFKKNYPEFILITQTPISQSNTSYKFFQKPNKISCYVHTLRSIKKKLLKDKYKIIYLSTINPKTTGFKKKDYLGKVNCLNILLKFKN